MDALFWTFTTFLILTCFNVLKQLLSQRLRFFISLPIKINVFQSPGKPNASNIKSDSIELFWEKTPEKVDHYQIRYKNKNGKGKWKFVETDSNENHVTISGLMANTSYIFQVRGIFDDQEGCYGPVNDTLKTLESLATTILGFCELKEKGSPSKYQLPVEENLRARNKSARTRQLILGIYILFGW